jgi:flagellar assembly protein FliH
MGAAKFTFDTEFRGGADIASNAARARQKKTFTTEEIETMCARARTEGTQVGQVRTSENIDRNIAALTIALRAALDCGHAEIETLREEAARFAIAVAAKLAPAALAALPAADVESVLRKLLHQAIGEPRVILTAAPDVIAAVEPKIKDIAHEEGYEGRVILNADQTLTGADCRIDWRGGGAERSEAAIVQAIDALIVHRFSKSEPVKG